MIIQRMAADLDFPVRIYLGPTVREEDGLAMSSRNRYLTKQERKNAPAMRQGLLKAAEAISNGERDASRLKDIVTASMTEGGFEIDYVEMVDGGTLQPVKRVDGTVLLACSREAGDARG